MSSSPLVQRIPAIINGISRQSPTVRHPSQCQEAENVNFSVLNGFSKRGGTEFYKKINTGVRTNTYKMHKFERDSDKEYAIIYGKNTFEIISLTDSTETPSVTITADAQAYIDHGTPDEKQLKLITIADATYVLNTLFKPSCTGEANEAIDDTTMPMLLVRNADSTWTMDKVEWNERTYRQQILSMPSAPTSGNFKLTYKGSRTSSISWDATAEDIEDALEDLDSVGAGKIQAFGGPIRENEVVINISPDLEPDTAQQMITVSANTTGVAINVKRGSDVTNSAPKIIKDSLGINDISYYRNRLVLAGDEYVVFSQADDLFNFYYEDPNVVIDSDPIEVALAAEDVTIVEFVKPLHDSMVVMTKAGQQFQLQDQGGVLSPSTVSITPSTQYETQSVRPVTLGENVYYAGQHRGYSLLYEYKYSPDEVEYRAKDISKHIFDYIPPDMVTMKSSKNNEMIVVVPRNDVNEGAVEYVTRGGSISKDWNADDAWNVGGENVTSSPQPWDNATITSGDTITMSAYDPVSGDGKDGTVAASNMYIYRRHQKDRELVQSAWGKWTFGNANNADNIMDILIIDNDMFILTRDDVQDHDGGGGAGNLVDTSLLLWKMTLTDERSAQTGYSYDVLLDHKYDLTSVSGGTGPYTYDLTLPCVDYSVDTVVLSDDFRSSDRGKVLPVGATTDGWTVGDLNHNVGGTTKVQISHASENLTNPKAMVGRAYNGEVQFSTLFMRNENNIPTSDGRSIIQKVLVDHENAGPYSIIIDDTSDVNRTDQTYSFTPSSGFSESFGTTTAWVHGRARDTAIKVKITEPKPCTISAIEYHGQYGSLLER